MARRPPPSMTIADIENLFVEKLTEKYQLTEGDLHRAFKKYDLDGSGFLDLTELSTAIQHFIPGIQRSLGKRISASTFKFYCIFCVSFVRANSQLLSQ